MLKNHRLEWELPGGRIEPGEFPEQCLQREIDEELKLAVEVLRIIDAQVFEVIQGKRVFLVTYLCEMMNEDHTVEISHEHTAYGWFTRQDLYCINIPKAYVHSIERGLAEEEVK